MVDRSTINKHMEVRGPDGTRIGVVDGVEGDRIKLTKNDSPDGEHHYIELADVQRVDEHVHVSTTRDRLFGATTTAASGTATASAPVGHEHPLPPISNPAANNAQPRGNYYLPWVLLGLALLGLLFALTRCNNDTGKAAVDNTTTVTNTTTVDTTSDVVGATPTAGVSGLGGYLGGTEALPRTFTFEKLNFDTAKADIRAGDRAELRDIAASLKQYGSARVRIVGYADARGSAEANATLGQRRADAVKAALVADGIAANRIETGSGGEGTPVDSNATTGGQAENRRTELVVTAR